MKGHTEVTEALKKILVNELTAVSQYFLHSRMCKEWGFKKPAEKAYQEALDEMKHAKILIDRILFLKAVPGLQKLHPLNIGQTVKQQMENDLKLEERAMADLKKAIEISHKNADFATKTLLEGILNNEEEHAGWLETQLGLIRELGEKSYLSRQIA